MATRIHVVGARNVNVDTFSAAFAELSLTGVETAGGWCWLSASVWGADTTSLDECVRTFPGPCIRVTSEDACRWYLSVFKQGLDPFTTCYPFGLLLKPDIAPSEEKDRVPSKSRRAEWLRVLCPSQSNASRPNTRIDRYDRGSPVCNADLTRIAEFLLDFRNLTGVHIPREIVARLLMLPFAAALHEFSAWHAGLVVDNLTRFGVPFNGPHLRATLVGESVTEGEFYSDLGNMPRFLADLGLGSKFEGWVEEASRSLTP
ncbi:MAG: hypothetical protein WC655_24135 [Candidatus Hydrogenedentales bacterium]|jgi:hypothetical protein